MDLSALISGGGSVDFFALRKRPDVAGIRLRDLAGRPGNSYTVEQIERAAREVGST